MHVLFAPFLEVSKTGRPTVAPAEISEIVPVRLLLDVAEQSSGTMVRNLWLKLSIEVARMQPEVLQPVTMTVSTRSFTK